MRGRRFEPGRRFSMEQMKSIQSFRPLIAILILCILPAGCFFSEGIGDIDVKTLKTLMEKERRLLVVDNRTTLEYASGHIPGAINIPEEEFYRITAMLPPEKGYPYRLLLQGIWLSPQS